MHFQCIISEVQNVIFKEGDNSEIVSEEYTLSMPFLPTAKQDISNDVALKTLNLEISRSHLADYVKILY